MLKIIHFISSFILSFPTFPKLCDLIFHDVYKIPELPIKNNNHYENDKMLKQFFQYS